MELAEAAENPAKQYEEAIWSRKQYLDTARGHYLSALAVLTGGKQEQTIVTHSSDSSVLFEDNALDPVAEVEGTSTPGLQGQGNTFAELDVQIQMPHGVLKSSERDFQSVKLQLNKALARKTKSQIAEIVCNLGSFSKELDINDAEVLRTTRTVSLDFDEATEPLPKAVAESSSLHRTVESLKAELENLKKEHAERKGVDAGSEFAARNLHFRLLKSRLEDEGCLSKREEIRETSEEVTQNKDEISDLNINAKGLKREHEAAKFSTEVEKRQRTSIDVDAAKEVSVRALDQVKSFPERIYPACVSAESSARIMISEDELELSSQQVGKSTKLGRGTLLASIGVKGGKCDHASDFSIRDFVFAARHKDISQNWPFSQKNLQLCLKHGVKDVLPPFQPVDYVRDSSMKRCLAEKMFHSEESNYNKKPSLLKNKFVPGILELDNSWKQELVEGYRDSDSYPTERERDLAFKATVTPNCQSEVESVSTSNLPLSEVSDEPAASATAANNTIKISGSQLSNKKCKVAVKMRVNSRRNTPEDITSACTVPLEAISSKICPVCENFSSSSNTTLNAHIDQCLSSQSPTWMKSSKQIKPRIKPRKMRLMTDICATAPCCTLEDLNRRNGTHWATNVDFSLEDADVPSERTTPGVPSKYNINNVDDGSVYIDSSGRKIRILSKLSDTSPSLFLKASEDLRPKKHYRKGKRSDFFSANRKKHLAKHFKYLKVTHQRKRFSSLKAKGRSTEACRAKEVIRKVGDWHIEQQQPSPFVKGFKAQEQNHPGVARTASRWIPFKISRLSKKNDSEAITKFSRCEIHVAKDMPVVNDQVENSRVERGRTTVKKHLHLPMSSLSCTLSNLRTSAIYPTWVDERNEVFHTGKISGGPSPRGAVRGNRKSCKVSLKLKAAQFDGGSTKESTPKSSNSTTVRAPPLGREVDIQPSTFLDADISSLAISKSMRSCHVGLPEGIRSRNSKTNALAVNRPRARVCQANSEQMDSAFENSCNCSGDEEAETWPADTSQKSGAMTDHPESSRISDFVGSNVVKVRQKQALECTQDRSENTNSSDVASDIHGNHSCVRSTMKGLHSVGDFIDPVSSSSLPIGVNEISLSTAVDPELESVADVSPLSKSLLCSDKFQGPVYGAEARGNSTQLGLSDEREMFYGNIADTESFELKTGDYILNFGQGSSFLEVDPIPIPGPPGSDLPSFSDMDSEDLHRSSLSNSLIQSSRDVDVVDGNLSKSPLPATSTISNLGKTDDFTVNEHVSLSSSLSLPNDVYAGWFGVNSGQMPGISAVSSHFTPAESERVPTCINNKSEEGMIFLCGASAVLNSEKQQCFCSRKEGSTWMNSQESHLLGQRPISSETFPGGKHAYSFLECQSYGLNNRMTVDPSSSYHRAVSSLETSVEAVDPFSRTGDYDAACPSAPILRLMGKDLRVSNKMDTDLSSPPADVNFSMDRVVHPVTEISSQVRSWESPSSQYPAVVGSLFHGQDSHILPARHFGVGSLNVRPSFGSHNQVLGGTFVNERSYPSFSSLGAAPLQR